MSQVIKIKGKLTAVAPALTDLAIREMCFVIPDHAFYIKKDAGTLVGPFTVNTASGDMAKSAYDTNANRKVDTAATPPSLSVLQPLVMLQMPL